MNLIPLIGGCHLINNFYIGKDVMIKNFYTHARCGQSFLDQPWVQKPWTLFTSALCHRDNNHFLSNVYCLCLGVFGLSFMLPRGLSGKFNRRSIYGLFAAGSFFGSLSEVGFSHLSYPYIEDVYYGGSSAGVNALFPAFCLRTFSGRPKLAFYLWA